MNQLIEFLFESVDPSTPSSPFWSKILEDGPSAAFETSDIFTPKRNVTNYMRVPRVVTFYYLSLNDVGALDAREYVFFKKKNEATPDPGDNQNDDDSKYAPIPYEDLPDVVADLIKNARDGGNKPRARPVGDFQGLKWKRRSYFVLFFDEAYWKIYERSTGKDTPILFQIVAKPGSPTPLPNHTFYDADFLDTFVNDSGGTPRREKFFCFVNYMKSDATGNTEVGATNPQYFNFHLVLEVTMAGAGNANVVVFLDPGGTNQGPPLEP